MPKDVKISIPTGSDIKQYLGRNWLRFLPWLLLIIACFGLYRSIFHANPLPQKVEKTDAYQSAQKQIDSLQQVIGLARDTINRQGRNIGLMQTELIIQRSSYRMNENKLHEILYRPVTNLPVITDDSFTAYLERVYGENYRTPVAPP